MKIPLINTLESTSFLCCRSRDSWVDENPNNDGKPCDIGFGASLFVCILTGKMYRPRIGCNRASCTSRSSVHRPYSFKKAWVSDCIGHINVNDMYIYESHSNTASKFPFSTQSCLE